MKVGVFDSGIGGLTVVKSLLEHKLFEEIIYYGDTARVPYGVKDKNTIIRYSLEALEFFKNFDLDIVIIACNTASAHAISELKDVSDIPVIGVIEPGVLACSQKINDKDSNILVIGTKATINSKKYETSLDSLGYKNLISIPTGLFVPIVEEGIFEKFPCEAVYGMHNWPGLAEGRFAVHDTAVMAANETLKITIKGKGGHAAMPDQCVDPIMIGAQVISAIQSVVSRSVAPLDSAVVSITMVDAGFVSNVIPNEMNLTGSLRYFRSEVGNEVKEKIKNISKQYEFKY